LAAELSAQNPALDSLINAVFSLTTFLFAFKHVAISEKLNATEKQFCRLFDR